MHSDSIQATSCLLGVNIDVIVRWQDVYVLPSSYACVEDVE